MKRLVSLFLVVAVLPLVGCDKVVTETSATLFEPAEVVDLYHSAARDEQYQDTELQYNYDWFSGEYHWMTVTVTKTRHIPERWEVAFRCKHGQFTVGHEGHNQFKTKELYERLKKGQKVTVSYTEKYEVRTNEKTGQQKKTLTDLDFLDAVDAGATEGK
ncbi:MAG: hypothetical protein Q8L24_01760 [bacterium]|nr:hypothetical protein [bacterium]